MNDLSRIVPKLLAQGLLALRGACVMPRLVNADYSNLAAQPGANIDVPIPSAITAQAVTPSAASPQTRDIAPETATIRLDRWMEAPFYLSDKDLLEVERGIIPMQAGEAVKAIANDVNACLLDLGRKFYGFVGTPALRPSPRSGTPPTPARCSTASSPRSGTAASCSIPTPRPPRWACPVSRT